MDIAFSDPKAIRDVQQKNLREHLAYCRANSPYYRKLLEDLAPDIERITLDQMSDLPFTDKTDFELANDEFRAVSSNQIVDIVLSSGTCGKPTQVMYTEHDLRRLEYNEMKSFAACGITASDIVLLTCTIDRCFVAGLAYFLGTRALGAAAIRNGVNTPQSHTEIIARMNPTAIVGVPTFLRRLGIHLQKKGIDPRRTAVKRLVCIGEPLRDERLAPLKVGADLESIWGAKVFSTYASSEMVTTFCECAAQAGGHLHPDLAIAEIVDNEGSVLPPGQIGELVITPMMVEGMPLIRFKTGDISFLIDEPCSCGRITPRLGPILGRKQQMMKVRGTTLYPQTVYSVLDEIDAVCDYYLELRTDANLSDILTICVALKDPSAEANEIIRRLQARLRVRPEVVVLDEAAIRRRVYDEGSRKPVRFFREEPASCRSAT